MTRFPSSYARRPRVILPRALVLALSLAACGDGAARTEAKDTVRADSASMDTSALAVARRQLGPEVRQAIPYPVSGYEGRFIAAAIPVHAWVQDPLRDGVSVAPGGHEIVILEMPDTSTTFAFTKPGLYVTDLPGTPRTGPDAPAMPDSNALRHLTGVQDLNSDGDAEVWSVQYGGPRHPYTWEIRAYDRGGRDLYQLSAKRRSGGTGLDPASWEPSQNLREQPAIRAWLEQKLQALETQFASADAGQAGAASGAAAGTAPAGAAPADSAAGDTSKGSGR
ncbi:MAG TPA: hypothetical protein VLK84_27260 [Longimicrobium sp.]|nr:hypothetical protein [Longimicrobium sp.]